MQWINTERDDFLKSLQIVTGIVERKQALPILSNILLEKNGPYIKLVSTDLEMQIGTEANIGLNSGSSRTTVSGRKLQDILQALPKGKLSLEQSQTGQLIIESGKSRFSLLTLPPEDFPQLSVDQPFEIEFTVSQNDLKNLICSTQFAMAQNDVRYYLNGLLLSFEEENLIAISTDGHRLAKASISLEGFSNKSKLTEVIVPRKTILEVQKLLGQVSQTVEISISEKNICFKIGKTVITSKLIDARYPDYKRVLASNYNKSCSVSRELLQQSLQRAALLTSEKFKSVYVSFQKGSLALDVNTPNNENLHDEIESNFDGDLIKMAFNVQYLLDLCNNIKSDSLCIDLSDPNSKIQIRMTKKSLVDFLYVVMPMRA